MIPTTKSPSWAFVAIATFVITLIVGAILWSLIRKPEVPTIVVTPPDAGAAGRAIDAREDAAVEQHEQRVEEIEREVVVRRRERTEQLDQQETAVRSRGRVAVAAWLEEFGWSIPRDGGAP